MTINIYIQKWFVLFFRKFCSYGFYSIVSNKFPLEEVTTKEFGKHSLLYTLLYIKICIPAIRSRYYSGWLLSYSTIIFTGLS